MKFCPKCNLTYEADMNFCLEDGTVLKTVDSSQEVLVSDEKTISFAPPLAPASTESENKQEAKTESLRGVSLSQTFYVNNAQQKDQTDSSEILPPTVAARSINENVSQSNKESDFTLFDTLHSDESPGAHKIKTTLIYGGLIALLLIGSVFGGVLYFRNRQPEQAPSTNNSNNSGSVFSNINSGRNSNQEPLAAKNTNSADVPNSSNTTANKPPVNSEKNSAAAANTNIKSTQKDDVLTSAATKDDNRPSEKVERSENITPPASKPNTPPVTAGPVNVGNMTSRATYLPSPEYPQAAKSQGVTGLVRTQVTVDESGNVTSARALSGHPLLRDSAEKAARAAKFNPVTVDGANVRAFGIVYYNFAN